MTTEEKQLLLKDLCERLPYGVMAKPNKGVGFIPARVTAITDHIDVKVTLEGSLILPLDMVQPYLRPMSSMTEEERKEFIKCAGYEIEESVNGRHYEYFLKDFCGTPDNPSVNADGVDWLNAHHFDFRNLIEKGLALEALEDMYKEK